MPLLIQMPVIILRVFPAGTRRDNRYNSAILQILPVRVTVIPLIGGNCARTEISRQSLSLRNIVILPRSRNELQRIPRSIDGNVDFGAESAPAASRRLLLLPAAPLQCSGGAGMCPGRCAVRHQEFHIRIPGTEGKEPFPYAFAAPAGKASVYCVPKSVLSGKKPPLCAAAHDPKHSFNKQADF